MTLFNEGALYIYITIMPICHRALSDSLYMCTNFCFNLIVKSCLYLFLGQTSTEQWV